MFQLIIALLFSLVRDLWIKIRKFFKVKPGLAIPARIEMATIKFVRRSIEKKIYNYNKVELMEIRQHIEDIMIPLDIPEMNVKLGTFYKTATGIMFISDIDYDPDFDPYDDPYDDFEPFPYGSTYDYEEELEQQVDNLEYKIEEYEEEIDQSEEEHDWPVEDHSIRTIRRQQRRNKEINRKCGGYDLREIRHNYSNRCDQHRHLKKRNFKNRNTDRMNMNTMEAWRLS